MSGAQNVIFIIFCNDTLIISTRRENHFSRYHGKLIDVYALAWYKIESIQHNIAA